MAREMTMSISSPVMVRRCSNSAASERTTLSYRCRMLLTSTRQAAIYASRDSRELVINDASSRSSLLSSAAGHGSPGRNNSSATVPAANFDGAATDIQMDLRHVIAGFTILRH
jgi:hypothetical protein